MGVGQSSRRRHGQREPLQRAEDSSGSGATRVKRMRPERRAGARPGAAWLAQVEILNFTPVPPSFMSSESQTCPEGGCPASHVINRKLRLGVNIFKKLPAICDVDGP